MDMKIDAQRMRSERLRRAWSQDHLATISGLGLRTVQRIERTGAASLESAAALASVLELPVEELLTGGAVAPGFAGKLLALRPWLLLPCAVAALLLLPPELNTQAAILLGLWVGFEVVVALARRRGAGAT